MKQYRVVHKAGLTYSIVAALLTASIGGTIASAQDRDARIQGAIDRGVAFLRSVAEQERGGKKSLVALALLKGGEPASSAHIQSAITEIRKFVKDGKYQPPLAAEVIYEAGVNISLLVDANAEQYRPEIEAIANFLIAQQGADGSWDYPNNRTTGDTSMSQYALLGFWAAERAGVSIPAEVYQKAVAWHVRTQKGGGFAYHPGTTEGPERGAPTLSMTAAGVSSLLIARMYLMPGAAPGSWEQGPKTARPAEQDSKQPDNPLVAAGVLEKVNLDGGEKKPTGGDVKVSSFDASIIGGLSWLATNFRPATTNPHTIYYYYTLERMAALANVTMLGNHDWFRECAAVLLSTQDQNGAFDTFSGKAVGTAFAVMFLTKASAKTLGRKSADPVGSGLLAGGRGLPTDLSKVQVRGGEIVQKEVTGPLDDLIGQLGKVQEIPIETVQQAIVDKVVLGDREALIGQQARLLELAEHPDVEIRRTAVWALGRSGELSAVPALLKALADPNIDVAVEAQNALCWVSRRPLGFGLPESPLADLEDASDAEKQAAAAKWRQEALKRWTDWYLKVRPYDERDDLQENQAAVGR